MLACDSPNSSPNNSTSNREFVDDEGAMSSDEDLTANSDEYDFDTSITTQFDDGVHQSVNANPADLTEHDVEQALVKATSALSHGGERRDSQIAMSKAVAKAITAGKHLIAQAGTGTGKSLAYLIPCALSGRKIVIATATKALQDQVAASELPLLKKTILPDLTWSILKGRQNYICLQRVDELLRDREASLFDEDDEELDKLLDFAKETKIGDKAELSFEPSFQNWSQLSVSGQECPGANKCPSGEVCFAELARKRAHVVDVSIINTHLLMLDIEAGRKLLPEHDIVVIDEAHELESVATATLGWSFGAGRLRWLANAVQRILEHQAIVDDLRDLADHATEVLSKFEDGSLPQDGAEEVQRLLDRSHTTISEVISDLRQINTEDEDANARLNRALTAATSLQKEIAAGRPEDSTGDSASSSIGSPSHVAWVDNSRNEPTLEVSLLDVAERLEEALFQDRTVIMTSATLNDSYARSVGVPEAMFQQEKFASPFDYQNNAVLFCPKDLPAPGSFGYEDQMLEVLAELITAAGGRTLALFTSWKRMDIAADYLKEHLNFDIWTQRDLPKQVLIDTLKNDPHTVLLATMSFWQGVDIPGPALSLVTIDRIPFPRPNDPLLKARKKHIGKNGFKLIDLARAQTLLAQGAGRLIRRKDDKGVVAILDSRLATRKMYRWELINAMPDFRRVGSVEEASEWLQNIDELALSKGT